MGHEKFKNIAIGIQSLALTIAVVIGGIWTFYTFNELDQVSKARAELKEIKVKLKQEGRIEVELSSKSFAFQKGDGRVISVIVAITNSGNKPVDIDFSRWAPLAVYPVVIDDKGNMGIGSKITSMISATRLPLSNPSEHVSELIASAKKEGRLDKIIALDKKLESDGIDFDLTEFVNTIENDRVLSKHPSMAMLRKTHLIENMTGLSLRPDTTEKLEYLVYVSKAGLYYLDFNVPISKEELLDSQSYEQWIKQNKTLFRWSSRHFIVVK